MQAEACGIAPDVRMNPILLKPESDHRSQLIVAGKAQGAFAARDYFARKKALMPQILEAFDSLDVYKRQLPDRARRRVRPRRRVRRVGLHRAPLGGIGRL